MRLLRIIVFLTLFMSNALLAGTTSQSANFISIADIHFDPLSSCSETASQCPILDKLMKANVLDWPQIFDQYGDKTNSPPYKDTNYRLFKATLAQMRDVANETHPTFVIILGDFLGHNFREEYRKYAKDKSKSAYQAFVRKTLQLMTTEIIKTFPGIEIYPVVGNNDSYTGDYGTVVKGAFFQETAQTWKAFFRTEQNRNNFLKEFPTAGYYEVSLGGNKKIIILNSVLFSIRSQALAKQHAAMAELQWLQNKLNVAASQKQKVILADHIPVGIDAYATFQNKFNEIIQFWQPKYTHQFEHILKTHKVVTDILSGHVHIDALQAITLKSFADISVIITPSVSPIFGNNPGFKVISYNPETFEILDTETYFYMLTQHAKVKLHLD